ncbi:hypothetical protein [Variovorax boronicumulans]|uniref:hypothetical protein n=1 Tax=Variovorax boronicumulans TaxID=436515 RepID=UPI0013311309|nr:hypothetical protein [Variovorax boronicumulans]
MFDVVRGANALYFATSRQRKSGGTWEGVVQIVSEDGTKIHVCTTCRDNADEAAKDAVLDAILLACDKPAFDD